MKTMKKEDVVVQNMESHTNLEKDILAEFQTHPYIVTLYSAFQTSDRLCLVMDYLSGVTRGCYI